jgi:hypothetical protein
MSKAIELEEQRRQPPFDQCRRDELVTDVLKRPREDSKLLKVLGVGEVGAVVLSFLDRDEATVLEWMVDDDPLSLLEEHGGRSVPEAKDGVDRLLELYKWLSKRKHPVAESF